MEKIESPRIISFKILPSELYIWKLYVKSIGKTASRFLISKVDQFLSLKPLKEDDYNQNSIDAIKKSRKYKQLLKIEKNEREDMVNFSKSLQLTKVSLRLSKLTLKDWDNYRESRYISRTALIRQTLNSFFSDPLKSLIKFDEKTTEGLSSVISSLICEVGSIDFQRLIDIFHNKVDPSTLMQVLNRLEERGTITRKRWDNYGQTMNLEGEPNEIVRKGWDLYVPTNPTGNSSETIALGELLSRLI
ncbi:MAG: hypothetical protein ACTSRK_20410 [Promethearchaeota archaeon]